MSGKPGPSATSPMLPDTLPSGVLRVRYESAEGRTFASRVRESGPLRIRHPRASSCEAVLINTGGGIAGGDRLAIDVALGPDAAVTLTTVAAEKVYRSERDPSMVTTRLSLEARSSLIWAPQEAILFDRSHLRRRFEIDLADTAGLVSAEMIVFGRTASGEENVSGSFRDSWRVRRSGKLVFADETAIEGPIAAVLERSAVANRARAVATLLVAGPRCALALDAVREVMAQLCDDGQAASVEGAASLRQGIMIARLVAQSAERLRAVVAGVLGAIEGVQMPRLGCRPMVVEPT